MDIYVVDSERERTAEIDRIFYSIPLKISSYGDVDQLFEAMKNSIPNMIITSSIESLSITEEVLDYLEKEYDEEQIPVLSYCLAGDEERISRIYDAGATDYVNYPFISSELKHKAQTWLEKREKSPLNRLWLDQIRTVSNDGLFAWDINTNESLYDSQYYKMAGYEPGEFPSQYEEWKKRVHPEDFPATQAQAGIYLRGDVPDSDNDFRFRRKDGSWMWIRSSIKFVQKDRDGKVLRLVGTHTDIDKERKQEAFIRAQNKIAAASAGQSIDELIRFFLDEIKDLSESPEAYIYEIRSRTESPVLKYSSSGASDPGKGMATYLMNCLDSHPPFIINDCADFENGIKKLMGLYIPFDDRITSLLFLGRKRYDFYIEEFHAVEDLTSFFLEIISRRRAERKVQDLQAYLAAIIDSMPSGLIGVDRDDNNTQANTAAQDLTGKSKNTILFRNFYNVFPKAQFVKKHIEQCRREKEIIETTLTRKLANGEVQNLEISFFPLVRNNDCDVILLIDDITEKNRVEELLVQSEKMLSVGGLAAGMAHELNNPLAGIMQTVYVLKKRLCTDNLSVPNRKAAEETGVDLQKLIDFMEMRKVPQMFESISSAGEQMAGIIKNMLSFARNDQAVKQEVNFNDLLKDAISLASTDYNLKKQYDIKNILFETNIDEDIPLISCEKVKIQQVIMNIIRNAAQAMALAGTEAPAIRIEALYRESEEKVELSIEDNGPGMDEKTRRRVFEPFFTTKEQGIGTGLGLSISFFIIHEDHKGEMFVESALGAGTKFTIILPV
ncbi:MAG: PAS domain-containing protein [Spirochaetales bacterium]|nr:PAS domain-containing protein [Spirochaetales bacterium]